MSKTAWKNIAGVALGVLMVAWLAGCGGADQSTEDAHDLTVRCGPESQVIECLDATPKRVIAFNNTFHNVSTACDGFGHRIFVTTDGGLTIFPDPTCDGYVEGQEPTLVVQP